MSWWVRLEKDGQNVEVDTHDEGGTYVVGGCDEAELNITYNYRGHFRDVGICLHEGDGGENADDGLFYLHGKLARDAIPHLEHAVKQLGTERDAAYWASTPGNAGHALSILLGWARQYPDAVFRVS